MDNLSALPPEIKTRLAAMSDTEKYKLLSDFETAVDCSGFCDWLSYAFMVELGK
tara:strand:- start:13188 stop:13349 length:162 start_codon:yes stop_codon:yes gene_type:complete